MTPREREANLSMLAEELNVAVHLCRSMSWDRSMSYGNRVGIGWNGSAKSYFAGLHELGHCAHGHFNGPQTGRSLEKEAQAWEWAMEHNQGSDTALRELAASCLGSYLAVGTGGAGSAYQRIAPMVGLNAEAGRRS